MPPTTNESALAPEFQDSEVKALIELRGKYNYPRAWVERCSQDAADIELCEGKWCRYVQPSDREITDSILDGYHRQLLTSSSPEDALLGLSSVVYWGFYTFGDEYSRVRVERLLNGYKSKPGTTPSLALERMAKVASAMEALKFANVIAAFSGVSQLGRTPFASKVVAFSNPNLAGVYDNRIQKGLEAEDWALHLASGVGPVSSRSVQKSYQAWCWHLILTARTLNLGISSGKQWHWNCGPDTNMKWRAVDVERALFAKYVRLD